MHYGHLNEKRLKLLTNNDMVVGLPKISNIRFCEACVYGKHNRNSFPTVCAWRTSKCLELVHVDLCGPMSVESFGGSKYFLMFTDDYSRMSWLYFLKFKSKTFDYFKNLRHI